IENTGSGDLEAFWRDLALIGALILTYTQTLPRAAARRAALRWTPRARRLAPAQPVTPRRVVTMVRPKRTAERPAPAPVPATVPAPPPAPVLRLASVRTVEPAVENIFRDDDPDRVRAGGAGPARPQSLTARSPGVAPLRRPQASSAHAPRPRPAARAQSIRRR